MFTPELFMSLQYHTKNRLREIPNVLEKMSDFCQKLVDLTFGAAIEAPLILYHTAYVLKVRVDLVCLCV